MCQEIGHTLGLAHNDTIRTDLNNGTCMDYTNDPTGTVNRGNGTLANIAPSASDFAALDGIYATLDPTQLDLTKPQFRISDAYWIRKSFDSSPQAVPEPATWALLLGRFWRRRHDAAPADARPPMDGSGLNDAAPAVSSAGPRIVKHSPTAPFTILGRVARQSCSTNNAARLHYRLTQRGLGYVDKDDLAGCVAEALHEAFGCRLCRSSLASYGFGWDVGRWQLRDTRSRDR